MKVVDFCHPSNISPTSTLEISSNTLAIVEAKYGPFLRRLTTDITNENINSAVDSWLYNPTSTEATYGPITAWNTASVESMEKCK